MRDVWFDLLLTYATTDRSAITGLVAYRRLLGDFADSPVTFSPDQFTLGLSFTRSF